MACKCAPALIQLRDEINFVWPDRDKSSDGCCASSAHHDQNPTSDHEPDKQGFAHAYDIDENLNPGTDEGDAPLTWLWDAWRANPDPRIKYLIYERRIVWPNSTTDTQPRAYHGVNAHEHHLHVSILPGVTVDTSPWLSRILPAAPAPAPSEEDEVPQPSDIVGVLETGDPPGADGLAPYWAVQRDGGVQARNGAAYLGSLPGLGEHRTDVIGIVRRLDRPGYVIVCAQLLDGGKSPTYSFPA